MTETAPTRRPRLTDVPLATPSDIEAGLGLGFVWRLWAVVAVFSAIVLVRSVELGIPLRDPDGEVFRNRLTKALVLLAVIAVAEAVVRAVRRDRSLRGVGRRLRERWTAQRLTLVLTGLLAYFVAYIGYRNLKSWNAFNTLRDEDLVELDKALFLGHSPASLLHDVLGQTHAAPALQIVYSSFSYLVVLSVVGSLALIPHVRRAYVFLSAAIWTWILGAFAYYLVPSLGPFAATPWDFRGLSPTSITESQAELLVERAQMLVDHSAPDSFVSIGAFASLHVGFTCMVLLMARYYGLTRTSRMLGVYLAAVVLATVYFGYHYVLDDAAGVILAAAAVLLGRWTVEAPFRGRRETT